MSVLVLMYVAFGVLLSVLGIPLWLRKVGPNPFYGFRVRQTLEDPEIWYEANAHAGRGLVADGLIVALAALLLGTVPGIGVDRYALSVTAILFLALGSTLLGSFRYLKRLAAEKSRWRKLKTVPSAGPEVSVDFNWLGHDKARDFRKLRTRRRPT